MTCGRPGCLLLWFISSIFLDPSSDGFYFFFTQQHCSSFSVTLSVPNSAVYCVRYDAHCVDEVVSSGVICVCSPGVTADISPTHIPDEWAYPWSQGEHDTRFFMCWGFFVFFFLG